MAERLPPNFNLAKILSFSTSTLRMLRSMTKGKKAYLVPLCPSQDDQSLAVDIQIPLFAGKVEEHSEVFSKSASKKIFELCDMAMPLCAWDVKTEEELLRNLTILISNYIQVNTWIFKLNECSHARGIAYLPLTKFKGFQYLKKDRLYGNLEDQQFRAKLYELLKQVLF